MDNEEELLDDRHFEDCADLDELDADAENKLLGLSDDEDNVEYEYVDENGKPVDINENSGVEYEVLKDDSTYLNQEEQDVLDLEVDHDLEFDDSAVSECKPQESVRQIAEPIQTVKRDEDYSSRRQIQNDVFQEDVNKALSDSSESDEDEEAGRGRFRSERPNVVLLTARKSRSNIPDSLDDVLRDDARISNFRQQRGGRRNIKDQSQRYNDRSRHRNLSTERERTFDLRGQEKSHIHSQDYNSKEIAFSSQTSEQLWGSSQNTSTNADTQSGTRKILINPHFKGAMPASTTNVPNPNYWSNEQNHVTLSYNETYQQNVPPPSTAGFNPHPYGVPPNHHSEGMTGLATPPNQMNMSSPMRPPLLGSEPLTSDYHWKQNPFPAQPPHMPPVSTNRLVEPPPVMFPPPRERPPPLLSTSHYFNGNRPYQMRPTQSFNSQWNSAPPRSNYDQYNSFDNHSNANVWRPPPMTQNQPLLSNPPVQQMPKFPDVRHPPPSLQMQQSPRPLMNFNTPPPNFSNSIADAPPTNSWGGPRQMSNPNIAVTNYPQMPPPLLGNQPHNMKGGMSFRLPLPTPNIPPVTRFKSSLLGSPVMINKQRSPILAVRPQTNVGIVRLDGQNWSRPTSTAQAAAGHIRKRALEDKTGAPLKQQRMAAFVNKQSTMLRRKPLVVNANIKEVTLVDNVTAAVTEAQQSQKPKVDDEDEETKKYRRQIELLNQKRAEILRIKEERREIMARQRRKLWLEQQQMQNLENNVAVTEQNAPVKEIATIIKRTSGPVQESSPAAVNSMMVKKRVVVLRRVASTPITPRKPVAAVKVNLAAITATSSLKPVAPVLPGKVVANTAAQIKPTVVRTLGNRLVGVATDASARVPATVDVKLVQPRQLRTVQIETKDGKVTPQVQKLDTSLQIRTGQEPIRRAARVVVQAGIPDVLCGGSNPNEGQSGQRLKVLNTTANNSQTTVLIENLSSATTVNNLRQLCEIYGKVEKIDMKKENGTAVVKFANGLHAKQFIDRCQRRMVDLSLIIVSLLNP